MRILRFLNLIIGLFGLALVPRHSVKMIIEYGNIIEARTGIPGSVRWLRRCALVMPMTDTDKCSNTVENFRQRGM